MCGSAWLQTANNSLAFFHVGLGSSSLVLGYFFLVLERGLRPFVLGVEPSDLIVGLFAGDSFRVSIKVVFGRALVCILLRI